MAMQHILTIKSKLCKMMTNVNQSTVPPSSSSPLTGQGLVLHPETFIMADLVADPELAARVCAIPEVMWIIKPAVGSAGASPAAAQAHPGRPGHPHCQQR